MLSSSQTPDQKKVRVALIGAGAMANAMHYPSLAEFADVELVGLCDLDQAKREATAKKFGLAATFADYRQMLDQVKPQAVYALMPPHVLFEVAMDVLERGHDLFVEKPPALTAFQAECLARAAGERRLISGVGFQRRYHPLFQACRQTVTENRRLHQVVSVFNKCQPPAATHPYYRGAIDILTSDAIHAVDALRFHAGGEVSRLAVEVHRLDSWYPVSFTALIQFDSGVTGVLLTNWRTGGRRLCLELHALGASAYANADGAAEIFVDNSPQPQTLDYKQVAQSDSPHVHQGFRAQARAFIDAVKSRRPLANDLADGAKTLRLIEQIYAAAEPEK